MISYQFLLYRFKVSRPPRERIGFFLGFDFLISRFLQAWIVMWVIEGNLMDVIMGYRAHINTQQENAVQ